MPKEKSEINERVVTLRMPYDLYEFFIKEGKQYGIYRTGTYIRTVLLQYRKNREAKDGRIK